MVYVLTLLSLGIIYILPRFTKVVPSPLVALAVMTITAISLRLDVPTVGDMGELPTAPPIFALPQVPFNLGDTGNYPALFPDSSGCGTASLLSYSFSGG